MSMDALMETLRQANLKVNELVVEEKGKMTDLLQQLQKAEEENEELTAEMVEVKKENQNLKTLQENIKKEKEELDVVFTVFYEKIQNDYKGKVVLDVGGKLYTTSVTTLCSEPKSMLATMFSGRFSLPQDGSIFIDRDGEYFGNILHYLRTKTLPLFTSDREIEHTLKEAEYYQLNDMIKAIHSLLKKLELKPKPKPKPLRRVYQLTKDFKAYINDGWTPTLMSGTGSTMSFLLFKDEFE